MSAPLVNTTPLLPQGSVPAEVQALARFDLELIQALFRELTQHAIAINSLLGTSVIIRQTVTQDTTFFVRTDGSDGNTGLGNTPGSAWRTLQHAIDVVAGQYDFENHAPVIQVADGTYTGGLVLRTGLGFQPITIQGNLSTPANVVIQSTTAGVDAVFANELGGTVYVLKGMRLQQSGGAANGHGNALFVTGASQVVLNGVDFGAASLHHLQVSQGATVNAIKYSVSGSAPAGAHILAFSGGTVNASGCVVTFSASVTFLITAEATDIAEILAVGADFTSGAGIVTGQRFFAAANGVIRTNTGNLNFFPGTTAGTAIQGGIYL